MTLLTYLHLNLSLSLHHKYSRYTSDGRVNVDNPGVLSGAVYLFECNYVGNNVKWTQVNIYLAQVC